MWFHTTVILLPCLISAQITIKLNPDFRNEKRRTGVIANGRSTVNTASDLEALGLTQSKVKENLETKTEYRRVDDVHVTDADKVISNLKKLNVALRIKSMNLLRDTHDIKHTRKIITNRSIYLEAYTKTTLKLNETVTTKWFDTGLTLSSNITHIIGFNGLETVSNFGQDSFASTSIPENITLENNENIANLKEIDLKPGESVKAVLRVTKVTLTVKIYYELSFSGDICFKYDHCDAVFLDHSCWKYTGLAVNEYLKIIGQVWRPYEVLTYITYLNPQVKLKRVKKKTIVENQPREIIFDEQDFK